MDAEEVYFDAWEGVVSYPHCYGDAGDEGAEFTFVVVGCSETDVPCLFKVGGKEGPDIKMVKWGWYHLKKEAE